MKTYTFRETNFNPTTNRFTEVDRREYINFSEAYGYFVSYREIDEYREEEKTIGDVLTTVFDDCSGYAIHYDVFYWDCAEHNEIVDNYTVCLEVIEK